MQKESWMQPALQASEAVLLPALERRSRANGFYTGRPLAQPVSSDAFRPVTGDWSGQQSQPLALSTYVRPRGSMAGRSVLRAAGIRPGPAFQSITPFTRRTSGRVSRAAYRHFRK